MWSLCVGYLCENFCRVCGVQECVFPVRRRHLEWCQSAFQWWGLRCDRLRPELDSCLLCLRPDDHSLQGRSTTHHRIQAAWDPFQSRGRNPRPRRRSDATQTANWTKQKSWICMTSNTIMIGPHKSWILIQLCRTWDIADYEWIAQVMNIYDVNAKGSLSKTLSDWQQRGWSWLDSTAHECLLCKKPSSGDMADYDWMAQKSCIFQCRNDDLIHWYFVDDDWPT